LTNFIDSRLIPWQVSDVTKQIRAKKNERMKTNTNRGVYKSLIDWDLMVYSWHQKAEETYMTGPHLRRQILLQCSVASLVY